MEIASADGFFDTMGAAAADEHNLNDDSVNNHRWVSAFANVTFVGFALESMNLNRHSVAAHTFDLCRDNRSLTTAK